MPIDRTVLVDFLSRIHLFRGVEEQKLGEAADLLEEVSYKAGTNIIQEGDPADYFYFIFEGQVKLSRFERGTRQFEQIGLLEKYDYFGEEVLESNWPRQVMADSVTDVILLRVSIPSFVIMLEVIPALSQRLQLLLDTYRLMLQTHFTWNDPEEMIHFISRRHWFVLVNYITPPILFGLVTIPLTLFFDLNSPLSVTPIVVLFIFCLITIAWFIWSFVDWTNDYYIVTSRRVVFQEKVVLIYDSRQEAPLDAVQSTSTTTSQIGRIFQFGNVAIRTFIGTILFRDVPYPELVMALIQEQQMRAQIREIFTEQSDIKKRIQQRIQSGPKLPPAPKFRKPEERPSAMRQFLSTMFHLRFEQAGTVTYRTHWFILVRRIWLPSLVLIGLLALVLYAAINQFSVLSIQATCGLSLVVGSFVALWWLYQYVDWHNDIYLITPDQVVDVYKKPLGQEDRKAAPLKNILSIEYRRLGIIGLLLNYGTVYIRVGDQTLTFDDVFRPGDVQRELFDRLARKKNQERQASLEDERRRMADWIAGYNELQPRTQPPQQQPPSRGGF